MIEWIKKYADGGEIRESKCGKYRINKIKDGLYSLYEKVSHSGVECHCKYIHQGSFQEIKRVANEAR